MPKILIVEDEQNLAQMYQELFEQEGYQVSSAGDVEEALETTKEVKPDLILLDILLPGETGVSFLSQLRQSDNQEITDTTVIAFSNYNDPQTKKEASEWGIKEYLIKTDYTPAEILDKVEQYINN